MAPAAAATSSGSLAAAFVDRINAERVGAGRARLSVDGAVSAAAVAWSQHMAATSILAHNPHLAGIVRQWRYLGENVGVGYSVSSLADAFWQSPEHRSNILDRHYDRIGVGVVDVGGKLWVTEDFLGDGRTVAAPARRAPTVHRARSAAPRPRVPGRAGRLPRRPAPKARPSRPPLAASSSSPDGTRREASGCGLSAAARSAGPPPAGPPPAPADPAALVILGRARAARGRVRACRHRPAGAAPANRRR